MATVTARKGTVPTRIDPELGPVKRCVVCRDEWPADPEFFKHGSVTCKACRADMTNDRPIAKKTATHGPTFDLEKKKRKDRERKAALRRDPILGEKLRERQKLAQRRFYERNRMTILERHRQSYAEKLDRPVREGFGRPRIAA